MVKALFIIDIIFLFFTKVFKFKSIIIFSIAPIIFITFFFSTNPIVKDRMFESTINSIKLSYSQENQFLPNHMTTFLKLVQICLGIIFFLVLVQKCIEKNARLMITVSIPKVVIRIHTTYFQLFAETGLVELVYLY